VTSDNEKSTAIKAIQNILKDGRDAFVAVIGEQAVS
jgi:hypothetical protein